MMHDHELQEFTRRTIKTAAVIALLGLVALIEGVTYLAMELTTWPIPY